MADISVELARILSAVYGEDVRGSIHDAIEKINDVSEVVLSVGTAVTSASSSSTGFYEDSLYLNSDTYELWKCTGVDTWASQGILQGEAGVGIASIDKTGTSGLVDTYTITYTDGNTDAFNVTNGADGAAGENGNKWYIGTTISGKSSNPTIFVNSGIAQANANDCYLNNSEGAVYHCTTGGVPSVATWVFDFTLSGGGGGTSDYADLTNKPQINSHTLSGNSSLSDIGLESKTAVSGGTEVSLVTTGEKDSWNNKSDFSGNYSDLSGKPTIPAAANNGQLTITQNGAVKANFFADQAGNSSANIKTGHYHSISSVVQSSLVTNGEISFSGIDDSAAAPGRIYTPVFNITANSTNKNPYARIKTLSGDGTSSMSVSYETDAAEGTTAYLWIDEC